VTAARCGPHCASVSDTVRGLRLATLCYVRRDGHTLMLYRNRKEADYHAGKWNGLGGKFEPGESPEQCMRREVLEESGLSVVSARLNGMITFPTFDGSNDWYVFVYTITETTGELTSDCREGELHWIEDAQVAHLNLWEGDRVFLPWLEKPGVFSARLVYDGPRLAYHTVDWY
jgi:8-oxo-dGTP diphosphatase